MGCAQMFFFSQHGYRVVAHDRRGHGRSEQTSTGNEYDTFADDLAELLEKLELKEVTLVEAIPWVVAKLLAI